MYAVYDADAYYDVCTEASVDELVAAFSEVEASDSAAFDVFAFAASVNDAAADVDMHTMADACAEYYATVTANVWFNTKD